MRFCVYRRGAETKVGVDVVGVVLDNDPIVCPVAMTSDSPLEIVTFSGKMLYEDPSSVFRDVADDVNEWLRSLESSVRSSLPEIESCISTLAKASARMDFFRWMVRPTASEIAITEGVSLELAVDARLGLAFLPAFESSSDEVWNRLWELRAMV